MGSNRMDHVGNVFPSVPGHASGDRKEFFGPGLIDHGTARRQDQPGLRLLELSVIPAAGWFGAGRFVKAGSFRPGIRGRSFRNSFYALSRAYLPPFAWERA